MIPAPRIGPFQLSGPALLAPMAGVTDAPFRKVCRAAGASLAASEMTTADVSLWHTAKSRNRLRISDEPGPRVVQIAGSEPELLAEAARLSVDLGADIIDINMGCPAKKVCRRLAGSALMQDEALVGRILETVVAAVKAPVTLKMRTGWNIENKNGVTIARIAEQAGIQAIAVHGRTRACAYRGDAEYQTVRNIKAAVNIAVFANGDINSATKALDVLNQTGADGVMIGRGACGQPWLFEQVNIFLQEKKLIPPPSLAIRHAMIAAHLEDLHRFYGEYTGLRVARKHLAWYFERLESGSEFRRRAVRAATTGEQMQIIRDYFTRRADGEDAVAGCQPPPVAVQCQEHQQRRASPAAGKEPSSAVSR